MEKLHNAILIGDGDTVVTVIEAMSPGDEIRYIDNGEMKTIKATSDIPIYHKAAVKAVQAGERVYKYCEIIGVAKKDIEVGEHVHTQNIKSEE